MKKTKIFEQIKIILALFALMLSFSFVKETLKLTIFLLISLIFIILSILYAKKEGLNTISEIIKFFLCFLNLTSLVHLGELISKTSYFNSILKSIYGPLFDKGINTNIYFLAIFVVTSVLLLGFNRLNTGEEDGK